MLRVMLDANVIVSSWTLDVLLSLGDLGMIDHSWSEKILEEYLRAMEGLKRRDAAEKKMAAANQAFPSAMVYGVGLPEGIELPDPDDRHVVAAALVGECDCIVTYNLRDFPQEALDKYGLRAMSPDDLVMELVGKNPVTVLCVIDALIRSKRRPPRTYDQEMEGLRRCGMRGLADWVGS